MVIGIIIIVSILFSGFFSGMEIAYVSNSRMQTELERKNDSLISKLYIYLAERPKKFITTMLLGNTLALVTYGYFSGKLITDLIVSNTSIESDIAILLLQTLVSTIIIIVTAEFIPKALFSLHSFRLFKFFTLPAYLLYWILSPLTWVVSLITSFIFKLLKVEDQEEESTYLKEELSYFLSEKIDETNEEIDSEIQIFQNALNFSELKARDCLIPRNEIIAVEITEEIPVIKQKFIDTGLSKIIIYRENIDNAIGYVHAFDLFKKPKAIKHILLPLETVHESTSAKEIMNRLIKKRKSIALVLDEYGGTSGMLTLEDIVEELFGDIEDEHDKPSFIEEKINHTEYRFSTRLEIDYLNDKYHLDLPESDSYETLGGLIVSKHENIPLEGEEIFFQNFTFHIKKVSETKIEEVYMRINKD